ncbi:hypothetical protein [Bordetella sp. 02P26C-1]|uniref:hypothetical protein n=1 Tax=Bordetella sp. 02P26C-1 TaxID=2683195 RepID=UPI0013545ACA|nr:hypothetical protein [Bordetella sp. 02P26C-1]MVW80159.1 hypothetical protein [Bordetella sp. 02P26C-1]
MAIYPIPEYLQDSHDGAEWAVASILEDRVVALLYLTDIAPELGDHVNEPSAEFMIEQWARKATGDLQQLQLLGAVRVGVVTTGGFEERWPLAAWAPGPGSQWLH